MNTSEPSWTFDFVLIDGFSGLSLVSAIETLKNANLVAGKTLYRWRLIGGTPTPLESSARLGLAMDGDVTTVTPGKDIVIVSGENAYNLDISRVKVWLSKNTRSGVRISGVGTGAVVMARIGFLDRAEAAVHPWYRMGFAEQFPDIKLSKKTHVSSGDRCSASGGTSSIDLFLDFIELQQGAEFANLVADSMCYRHTRLMQNAIDASAPNSTGVLHPLVSNAVSRMEKNIEFPIAPSILAEDVGVSTRQLERLFKKYIGQSPKRHYMRLRLQEAYRLLVQTRFDVLQIGLMTGFTSPSHFAKCFRTEFGATPHELRNNPPDQAF